MTAWIEDIHAITHSTLRIAVSTQEYNPLEDFPVNITGVGFQPKERLSCSVSEGI